MCVEEPLLPQHRGMRKYVLFLEYASPFVSVFNFSMLRDGFHSCTVKVAMVISADHDFEIQLR